MFPVRKTLIQCVESDTRESVIRRPQDTCCQLAITAMSMIFPLYSDPSSPCLERRTAAATESVPMTQSAQRNSTKEFVTQPGRGQAIKLLILDICAEPGSKKPPRFIYCALM